MSRFIERRASAYLLVVVVSSITIFVGLGQQTLENHECYVAIAAGYMADTDNWGELDEHASALMREWDMNRWLVPVFNGEPRLVKPPLAYWCGAALLKLGMPLNEFTARTTSAIASVLLAVVTLALGRRMFSPRIAMISTLLLVTTMGTQYWGRNARPEMLLALGMTAAMYCFYAGLNDLRPRGRIVWMLAGFVVLGIAGLAKQVVPVLLAAPLVAYVAWQCSLSVARAARQRKRLLAVPPHPGPLPPVGGRGEHAGGALLASDPVGGRGEHAGGALSAEPDRPGLMLIIYMVGSVVGLIVCATIMRVPQLQWWTYCGVRATVGTVVTAVITIGGPLLWYVLAGRAFGRMWRLGPVVIVGVVLMLLVCIPWFLYIDGLFPTARKVWLGQTTERMATEGASGEAKMPGYYVVGLVFLTVPWCLFLPGGLSIPFRKRFGEHRGALVFLFLWTFCLVLLFSVSLGKSQHYILPTIPAVCLLMGCYVDNVFFGRKPSVRRAKLFGAAYVLAAVGAAIAGGCLFQFGSTRYPDGFLLVAIICGVAAVPLLVGALMAARGKTGIALSVLIATAALTSIVFFARYSLFDRDSQFPEYARSATIDIGPDARVAGWGFQGKMAYYLRRNIPSVVKQRDRFVAALGETEGNRSWREWLANDKPLLFIFSRQQHAGDLAKEGFIPVHPEEIAEAPGRKPILFRHKQ